MDSSISSSWNRDVGPWATRVVRIRDERFSKCDAEVHCVAVVAEVVAAPIMGNASYSMAWYKRSETFEAMFDWNKHE